MKNLRRCGKALIQPNTDYLVLVADLRHDIHPLVHSMTHLHLGMVYITNIQLVETVRVKFKRQSHETSVP